MMTFSSAIVSTRNNIIFQCVTPYSLVESNISTFKPIKGPIFWTV